jgi:hypothetical protein
MKLVKVSTIYPAYLSALYADRAHLAGRSYGDQLSEIFSDCFGTFDAWSRALAPQGYQVTELLANVRPLQESWARATPGPEPGLASLLEITARQVAEARPEVLYLTDYSFFPAAWIRELRERVPSIRLVVMWCGAPFGDHSPFGACDLILTCIPELKETISGLGYPCAHLHHAFDERVIDRLGSRDAPSHPFTFVGQVHRQDRYHRQREALLLGLTGLVPLEIFTPSAQLGLRDDLSAMVRMAAFDLAALLKAIGIPGSALGKIPALGKAARWDNRPRMPVDRQLKRHMLPPLFGMAMYRLLAGSKVSLNTHIDVSPKSASNMRLFEAAGVGSCLLTDHRDNLAELFDPDREVVTYRSAEECAEKARYLLDNPAERESIARAGRERVLNEHTYTHRAPVLDRIIRSRL